MNREFEIEHFGFTAEQLSLERKHFLQKIIRNALDAMVNKLNVGEKTTELLVAAKEEILENVWMSINSENEKLNILDKKYFTIPDHVLLPPYFDHVNSYTEEDEQELDKNFKILKQNFLENSTMIALLNMENSQYKNFTTFVESEVKLQQQLKDSFSCIDVERILKLDDKQNSLLKQFEK